MTRSCRTRSLLVRDGTSLKGLGLTTLPRIELIAKHAINKSPSTMPSKKPTSQTANRHFPFVKGFIIIVELHLKMAEAKPSALAALCKGLWKTSEEGRNKT